jgi:hypothetical protein
MTMHQGRRASAEAVLPAAADRTTSSPHSHLKDAEKAGDTTHQEARDAMQSRWRHPKKSMDWFRGIKQAFAALPDD